MSTITINVPDSFTVEVRGHDVTWNLADASDETRIEIARRAFEYGLGRLANDKAAQGLGKAPKKDEAPEDYARFALACCDNSREMVKSWIAGDFTKERASTPSDPIAAETMRLAALMATKVVGKIAKDDDAGKARFMAEKARFAAMPALREKAARNVAEAAELAALVGAV